MRIKIFGTMLSVLALICCMSLVAFSQEITGSIVGSVRDSAGASVPGATVTVSVPSRNDEVIRTVTTNDSGAFSAPNVPVGVYTITVEAPNFKKSVTTGVKVDVGARRGADVTLEAGGVDETVTVEAGAIAVELTTPTVGTTITGDQARELPINNRNWVQLITLAPGVSNNLSDQVYVGTTNPEAGQANTVQISVNGARSSQNTFTIDGADVTDRGSNITIQGYPSVDSIGEFKVLRSLYPAESGRSGGGQVNVVTRSGSEKFHGSLFEFVRNDKFNANSYFNNLSTTRDENGKAVRPPFRYNNFGGTIGGPVWFLNFGEHDPGDSIFAKIPRTYFFFSEEVRRDVRYPTANSEVPDADLRNGIFSSNICLQATGTTCNTILPAGTPLSTVMPINPVAQQYLNYIYNNFPQPNNPSGTIYSLAFPTRSVANFRQEIIKIDTNFSDDWSAYYRYQRDTIPTQDPFGLFTGGAAKQPEASRTVTDSPGRTHTFQTTYVVTPNLILEGGYNFGYGAIISNNVGLIALANSPITPPLPYPVSRDRVPSISGNGFTALGGFGPYDNFSWKQNFRGNVTWVLGQHTMKFGTTYSMYRKHENALAGSNEGLYSGFNTPGASTRINATGVTGTENNNRQLWANFLMGTNTTFTQASFDYTADLRQKTFEAYAQDEWRFRNNITVYAGVRYSFFGSPWDKNGFLTNFVPELWDRANAPTVQGNGLRIPGSGNYCNGLIANTNNYQTGPPAFNCTPTPSPWGKFVVKAPKTDFAPRIGIAWDPFGDGTTSVRTGYGIYHDQVLNGTLLQQIGLNPPYQQTCNVVGVNMANPVPGGNCVASASNTVNNLRALEPEWKTPYLQHWSLDVQHTFTPKTLVSIGYYGSKGVNQIGSFELNALAPGYAISLGPTGCAVGASTTPTTWCLQPGRAFTSSATTTIIDQIRPFEGYRSINMIQPRYDSSYHSLQLSATQRFSDTSQINLAYTWSKNLTNNQSDRSHAPQDGYDIGSEWGRAALDRRHILTVNWFYELPFFKNDRSFAGAVLGGWEVQGIATFQTGLPFTATTSSFDPAGLGIIPALVAGTRPNQICNPNAGSGQTRENWFDASCFTDNPLTTATDVPNVVGNAGRGTIHGPGMRKVDLTLSKNFRFNESMRLQLRAEAFNVFNWTNFSSISTNVTSLSFGQATTARDPRTMQFGAKFYF